MEATTTTIPAPAQHGRPTKVASIAIAVAALVLAIAGTVALAGNAFRDSHGYFNWPSETFTSDGYAIAMKTVDISHAPRWVFNQAGLNRVRVKANSDHRIFIGIGRTAAVDRYLRGTEHDEVSGLSYNPFQVNYDHTDGHAPSRTPGNESFWVKSTSGSGNLTLTWHPRPGSWRAVLMNTNGSRGVTAQLQLGARSSLLWWLGGALLGAAVLAGAIAAALRSRARVS
jgi:hypothetical protein